MQTLEEDEFARNYQLAHRLDQVHELMESDAWRSRRQTGQGHVDNRDMVTLPHVSRSRRQKALSERVNEDDNIHCGAYF